MIQNIKTKQENIISVNTLYLLFLRDIHKGNLAFENADEELSQLVNKLKDMGKGKIPTEKRYFLKNAGLFLT